MAKPPQDRLHPETYTAQGGHVLDATSGGVVPAIHPATTFARDPDNVPMADGNTYLRYHATNGRMVEQLLARLEGAEEALIFPSGMAAVAAVFRTVPSGATVLVQSQIYWGTTAWIRDFCSRRNVRLIEVEASDLNAFTEACEANLPYLAWIETPSNPWLRSIDIAASAEVAHRVGAILVADMTAATPILTQGLAHGADLVMHSATKAINGHSDVLAGALAVADAETGIWAAIRADRDMAGAVLGPFEAWLLLRGMRTLPLRVERMSHNALKLAEFLKDHPRVETVMYPGLPEHQGHEIACRQMSGGFGCLLSAVIKGGAAEALDVAGKLRLFQRATSLGGVESLVEHRHTIEPHTGIPEGLLRLSVGIENAGDLIDDLGQALGQ